MSDAIRGAVAVLALSPLVVAEVELRRICRAEEAERLARLAAGDHAGRRKKGGRKKGD